MGCYLLYTGLQDIFLTENPDFTYFRTVLVRDAPCITQGFEIPFDNQNPIPGQTCICTVPRNGDFMSKATLKIIIPPLTTPLVTYWTYDTTALVGQTMYFFRDNGTLAESITITGTLANTNEYSWCNKPSIITSANQKFRFLVPTATQVTFDSIDLATFWGFIYNPIFLYGGRVQFVTVNSQTFWQDSGWVTGVPINQSTQTSYPVHIIEDFIRSVTLILGGQEIQAFDSFFIRYLKESGYSYKNRPVMDILENGDTSVVNSNRIFYYELPFEPIPIHALGRQDIRIVIDTNALTRFSIVSVSLIIQYDSFPGINLPNRYDLDIPQVTYFQDPVVHIRGRLNKIVTGTYATPFQFSLNGDQFCDTEYTEISSYEHDVNVPFSSNTCTIVGSLMSSRFRSQTVKASSGIYTETTNTLIIRDGLSGLKSDTTQTSQWRPSTYQYKSSVSYPLAGLVALDSNGNKLNFIVKSNTSRGTFQYNGTFYSYDTSMTSDPNLVAAVFTLNANNYATSVVISFNSTSLQKCVFTRMTSWDDRGILINPLYSLTTDDGYSCSLNSTSTGIIMSNGSAVVTPIFLEPPIKNSNGYITSFKWGPGVTSNLIDASWTPYAGLPAPVSILNGSLSINSVYYNNTTKYCFSPESSNITGRFGIVTGSAVPPPLAYNYSYVGSTQYTDDRTTIPNGFSITPQQLSFVYGNTPTTVSNVDTKYPVTTPMYLFIQ